MLEEVEAEYETVVLSYDGAMHAPEYRAINPMGKVPAIRHGDVVVTETPAIIAYLADAFADAGLAPPLAERGAYYRWLFFGAGPVDAAVMTKLVGLEVPKDAAPRLGFGTVERVADTLDAALAASPFIAGDTFTAADVYIGSQLGFAHMMGAFEERPSFVAYRERVCSRPAYKRATEKDDAAMAKM
jgi:glutathione S-transferase